MDLSTGLALLNMLSLNIQLTPSVAEMEERYEAEYRLREDLFNRYDGSVPNKHGQGLELIPIMTIDHIRTLKDDKGTMTMSVTFVFTWMDERMMWNATQYTGIRRLSFNRFEYGLLWVPVINLADIPSHGKPQDVFGNHDLDITINDNGIVRATIKALVTVPCYFTFGDWPNDYQNCSLTLMTPYFADEFRFAKWGAAESARFLQERATDVEDFELIGVESTSYFLYLGMDVVYDFKEYAPDFCRAFFRYNILLKRVNRMAFMQVSAPLIAISMFLAISSILPNKYGLFLFLFLLMTQVLFSFVLAKELPDGFNEIPRIAVLAMFMFFQTIVIFAWKVFSITSRYSIRKMEEPSENQKKLLKGMIWMDLALIPYLFGFVVVTVFMVV